ncbi:zwittermicin A synthase ZmaJ isoform X1 [Schistocerca cancellata]|uniref:zwittermicin A synthase ZmaJ isoform X1 n=2 Tax=Schistocerca cancellata TaxID=274614 RepID=UPI002118FB4F|nr:zwittermicin A synthase ZmaJ isoform X1 [Schistocerca cancellata]
MARAELYFLPQLQWRSCTEEPEPFHGHAMGSVPQLSVLRGEVREDDASAGALLHRILEEAAARADANQVALVCPGSVEDGEAGSAVVTLRALDEAASRVARALVRRVQGATGAGPNSDGDWLVAVDMRPRAGLVVALLAAWKAGAAYLPLGPGFPAARVHHILREARPALVIADAVDTDVLGGYSAVSFSELEREAAELSGDPLSDAETLQSKDRRHESPLALVLYTSGSTGVPKGVRLTHATVLNRLRWQWRTFPFSEGETCAFKTALSFVDHVAELWAPLLQGRPLVVVPAPVTKDPQRLALLLHDHQVGRLVLVPSLLRALLLYLELQPRGALLSQLRLWVCSGESLPAELARLFFRRFPGHTLANFYGSTEVMGDVTYHLLRSEMDLQLFDKVPIGVPVDNTLVYVVDTQFRPVLAGDAGEVLVAGRNLAAGYVGGRDPHRFVANPLAVDRDYSRLYRTGDYARVIKGVLIYEGRTDSQIKVRGHRVDISEVEKAVNSVSGVDKGVVLCYKPGELNQALLAFVTVSEENPLTASEIKDTLNGYLAPYMMPEVLVIDSIPLLVNGKTDRQQLLRDYEEICVNGSQTITSEIDYSGVPEKQMNAAVVLFETVAAVLGNPVNAKLSLESNFYEVGGNSLNSVYLVTRLRDRGYIIGISDFISAKSFAEVLDRMSPEDESTNSTTLATKSTVLSRYRSRMLANPYKADVARMVTDSFYEKADLEQWLVPRIPRSDYENLVDALWQPLVEKNFSFIVENENGEPVGVAFNFDAHDEPPVEIHSDLLIVFDFLEYLEGPLRDQQLPQGKGQVLHSFMMATHHSLSYQQNVEVIQFMEEEVMRLARNRGFAGVFTTNTSPLTQQLGTDVYDYKVLLDYQVNTYVAPDGSKPFGEAPDWQRAVCSWRPV